MALHWLLSLGALGSQKVEVCARDQTMTLAGVDLESGVTEGRVTIATTVSSSLGMEAGWGMGDEGPRGLGRTLWLTS